MPGGLDFDFRFGKPGGDGERGDVRMRILVMGDFRGARPAEGGLSAARISKIDVDVFDAVMERIGPALDLVLPGADASIPLTFAEIDDFEPDALWRSVDAFARLRDLRKRLLAPATFAAAADELRGPASPDDAAPARPRARRRRRGTRTPSPACSAGRRTSPARRPAAGRTSTA